MWQSMPALHGRWIASFLAMTQWWCSGRAQVIAGGASNFRHCESRSDVAIYDFARTADGSLRSSR
jgi:hypothetical protein